MGHWATGAVYLDGGLVPDDPNSEIKSGIAFQGPVAKERDFVRPDLPRIFGASKSVVAVAGEITPLPWTYFSSAGAHPQRA